MPSIVTVPVYQINSDNSFDPNFPKYFDFPTKQILVDEVSPPLNNTRGVLCYSRIKLFSPSFPTYYSNLTRSQVLNLANTGNISGGIGSMVIGSTFIIG